MLLQVALLRMLLNGKTPNLERWLSTGIIYFLSMSDEVPSNQLYGNLLIFLGLLRHSNNAGWLAIILTLGARGMTNSWLTSH